MSTSTKDNSYKMDIRDVLKIMQDPMNADKYLAIRKVVALESIDKSLRMIARNTNPDYEK